MLRVACAASHNKWAPARCFREVLHHFHKQVHKIVTDLPGNISITEEGPREGFQIESASIVTEDKVRLIDALSQTGVEKIQVCSFVSPKLVPGWADADSVVEQFNPAPSVDYIALWFNKKGLDRALQFKTKLSLSGCIHVCASEAFSRSNLNRDRQQNLTAMRDQCTAHIHAGVEVNKISVMAAFGCNFAGNIEPANTVSAVEDAMSLAAHAGATITEIALADTMGWSNPLLTKRVVGDVRSHWPDIPIRLHLHDTRGLGIANASAALGLGVKRFDTTVGGLGGCPFAKHKGAPGNIATEELVLLAEESGVSTGVDIDAMIDAGHLAESIIGRQLPSAVLRGGSLDEFRVRAANRT